MKRSVIIGIKSVVLAVVMLAIFSSLAAADTSKQENHTVIYLFWGDGCPHCAEAKPFLERLSRLLPGVEVRSYEVWYVEENQNLFEKMATRLNFTARAVPTIIIGDRHWEGFTDSIAGEIEAAIRQCQAMGGCIDAGKGLIPQTESITEETPAVVEKNQTPGSDQAAMIALPLLGSIDLTMQPLWVSTLFIAFIDGFNPCSLWVLSILLAIALHSGSRKRVFLIGAVFLTVTALIYALFITGLFTIFSVISYLRWIQIALFLVAAIFGLINIKDYFWYKEGISLTISDQNKPKLFQQARKVMDPGKGIVGLVLGTIILAGGVSLIEFSCTAGFPVLWTNLLVKQNIGTEVFIFLLLFYLIIYQIDEMVLFAAAVLTLKSRRINETQGRILKLIGGVLMLSLAVVMLADPSIMSDVGKTLMVFGGAFLLVLIILGIHRYLLPRWGLANGSEKGDLE